MIKIRCGKCGQSIGAPDNFVGKTVSCPKCKAGIQIPQAVNQEGAEKPSIIKFRCPNCNQKIGLPAEYAGKHVRCAKCKNPMLVPPAMPAPKPPPAKDKVAGPSAGADDGFKPFNDLPDLDGLLESEKDAPVVEPPLRLTPVNEPAQQGALDSIAGRISSPAIESTGARGNSMPLKIDNTLIALLASIVFVIVGGMLWGLLAKYTNREFGLVAWGIGVLAGMGI